MSDKNVWSFVGDDEGRIWLNGDLIEGPGPGIRVFRFPGDVAPPDGSYADVLKFSGVQRLVVTVDGTVYGGREDCVDMNRKCRDVTVSAKAFSSGGKYVWTCKGGSSGCALYGRIVKHGSVTDVEVGNHSDQSDEVTTETRLHLTSDSPIRYNQLHATSLRLMGPGPYKPGLTIPGAFRTLFAKVYAFLKKHLRLPI